MAVEYVGVDVRIKFGGFGDSRSNGSRDIRRANVRVELTNMTEAYHKGENDVNMEFKRKVKSLSVFSAIILVGIGQGHLPVNLVGMSSLSGGRKKM